MILKEQIRITLKEFLNEREEYRKKFSDDDIRLLLKKYDTLKDLIYNDKSLYYSIKKRGDDYFKKMTKDLKREGLSKDDVRNIARQYKYYKDFTNKWAYHKAKKFGQDFFDEVTAHMLKTRNAPSKYQRRLSDDEIWKIAKQYSTITEFRKKHFKEYRDAINIGIDFMKKITSHMKVPFRPRMMSKDEIKNIVMKYNTMEDFKENEKNAYNALMKSGRDFYKDVTSHFISSKQGTTQEKYSPDELIQIASRYDNEKDFFNGDKEAYGGAIKLGSQFFNNITNHMKYPEGIDLSPIISNALREWKNKYQN